MFVQVFNENGAILFPAVSPALKNSSFNRLLASEGVSVSGKMENGRIAELIAHSPADREWTYRIPASLAKNVTLNDKLISSEGISGNYAVIRCNLEKGDNILTK
jgi:hypothetical protein